MRSDRGPGPATNTAQVPALGQVVCIYILAVIIITTTGGAFCYSHVIEAGSEAQED